MKIIFIAGDAKDGRKGLADKLISRLKNINKKSQCLTIDSYRREHTHADTIGNFELNRLALYLTQSSQDHTLQSLDYLVIEGVFALALSKMLPSSLEKLTVFIGTSTYQGVVNTRLMRNIYENNYVSDAAKQPEPRYVGPAFFDTIIRSKSGVDIDILNDPHVNSDLPHPLDKAVDDVFSHLGLVHESNAVLG